MRSADMTDSWKTNKETKRDNSGDRVSRLFVLGGQHVKEETQCLKCKHECPAEIRARVKGRGCPECGKKKIQETRRKKDASGEKNIQEIFKKGWKTRKKNAAKQLTGKNKKSNQLTSLIGRPTN